MAFPDEWDEVALVAISKIGGSDIQFAAITDSVQVEDGDYPGEGRPNLAGGRIWKQSAQEDGQITLKLTPIELSAASGVGLFQQFNRGDVDASEPLATDNTWPAGINRARDLFRVAILWTNDTSNSTANGATAASTDALRFYATGCRIISHKMSGGYTGTDPLTIDVVFKFPAFNKAGTTKSGNWQSGNNTALATLGSYT